MSVNPNAIGAGATAANPLIAIPSITQGAALSGLMHAFGGGDGHHTQMQYGNYDLNSLSPNDLALKLGTAGYGPAYDSNDKGSFERNYNQILSGLTPDQLIQRYSKGTAGQFATAQDQLQKQAYDSAKSILGRDISGTEFAQILPLFQGPNGLSTGRQYLAAWAQQEANNPQALAKNASKYYNQVNQLFQQNLGRAATQNELDHYGGMLASNQTDAYGLQQQLQGSPEYQQQQDTKFQNSIIPQTQQYVTDTFNRVKPDIVSQFANNGIQNSSALDFALTNMLGNLSSQESNYVTGLKASQYGGNKDLALQQGQGALDQYLNNYYNQKQNNQNMMNSLVQRGWNAQDYQTQMNDYMNFVNSQRQSQPNGFGSLAGGLLGAGLGAAFSPPGTGPMGAGVGYNIGSGLGTSFDYLNH
jgi:hypothetical protein